MINIRNAIQYIQSFLKIQTKDGSLRKLILNEPQRRLYDLLKSEREKGKPIRVIILKARQMGFSTLVVALIFWATATAFFINSLIVAHKEDATASLFKMVKLFYDCLPPPLKPLQRASNAQELVLDKPAKYKGKDKGLSSRLRCATAGGTGVGRGWTFMNVLLSEFAFWPGNKMETYTGIMQAVPDGIDTMVVIESTANGFNEFKKLWDSAILAQRNGTEGFLPVFFPWFEMSSYRKKPAPDFQRTEEEQQLAETFGLDDEQLAWRRWCIEINCGGDVDLFHQEYPSTPDEAFISTGRCVFDKKALVLRREQVRTLAWEYGAFRIEKDISGHIVKWEWIPDSTGPIRILKHPEQGVPYVLGGDTAGTGTDKFAGTLIDNRTGMLVAVVHHQFGERMFAEQMYCLGMYYNTALIGVETNYSTFPEMILEELGYPKLFVRERYDNFQGKIVNAFGFDTNTVTRPVLVDTLKDVVKESLETVTDFDLLGEMLTFVYDDKWKAQAEQGEHDDLVMAFGITHRIRHQQSTVADMPAAGEKRAKWTTDMWEDYQKAPPEQRRMMEQMWGKPEREDM